MNKIKYMKTTKSYKDSFEEEIKWLDNFQKELISYYGFYSGANIRAYQINTAIELLKQEFIEEIK